MDPYEAKYQAFLESARLLPFALGFGLIVLPGVKDPGTLLAVAVLISWGMILEKKSTQE